MRVGGSLRVPAPPGQALAAVRAALLVPETPGAAAVEIGPARRHTVTAALTGDQPAPHEIDVWERTSAAAAAGLGLCAVGADARTGHPLAAEIAVTASPAVDGETNLEVAGNVQLLAPGGVSRRQVQAEAARLLGELEAHLARAVAPTVAGALPAALADKIVAVAGRRRGGRSGSGSGWRRTRRTRRKGR